MGEIITENLTKLMTKVKPQIQEAQRTPSRKNTKNEKSTFIHITFKLYKIKSKEKILKESERG